MTLAITEATTMQFSLVLLWSGRASTAAASPRMRPSPEAGRVRSLAWGVRALMVLVLVSLLAFWFWQVVHDTSARVGEWTRQLQNGNAEDRREAAMELGKLSGRDARAAMPALAAALGDADEQVVVLAVRSLSDAFRSAPSDGAPTQRRTAILALAGAMKDTRPRVRAEVAGVLSYTGVGVPGDDTFAACTRALTQAVGDPSDGVRQSAVRALGQLGSRNLAPQLEALVAALDTDPSVPVRKEAAGALGGFWAAPDPATDALLHTLRGNDVPEVRAAAAKAIGELAAGRDTVPDSLLHAVEQAEADLSRLLDDPTPANRIAALRVFEFMASHLNRNTPPPRLVASLDDPAEAVRKAAIDAVVKYREGPETLVPVALRRIPKEGPGARFTTVFWSIRLEPSVLPVLIEGMSSQDTDVCLSCAAAINHMGRAAGPALPAVVKVIRKELELPRPPGSVGWDILAIASGAVGEISTAAPPQPETVDLLTEVVKRSATVLQKRDPSLGVTKPESLSEKVVQRQNKQRLGEAVWSLGILGRPAAPAVPVLLSVLETLPVTDANNNRRLTAEALAEITRGTADEDRALAALAKAWKSAMPLEKPVFARALRSFGPKAVQLVPELKRFPRDGTRTEIRRVRYPRSPREQPVRE